jgi:hypothetical protein
MSVSTPACFAYSGSLDEITSTASPGLLFLKAYLSASDSLTSTNETLREFVSPSAVIFNNSAPPAYINSKLPSEKQDTTSSNPKPVNKREKRNAALQALNRELRRAWDIDHSHGRRTVIFESRNFFVFAADPEAPVCMPEAGTLELELAPSDEERGVEGYWLIESRSWHDRVELRAKRAELGC